MQCVLLSHTKSWQIYFTFNKGLQTYNFFFQITCHSALEICVTESMLRTWKKLLLLRQHKTHIVPPKSASNTLKNSSNKREQKGGHLLTKRNYIVKRDTPETERQCVCVRERKGYETAREKDCKGLWIWQVVTDDPSGGVVWVCVWQMEWRDRMCLQSRAASTAGSRTQDMYMWLGEKEKDGKWERLTFIKTEYVWKMKF